MITHCRQSYSGLVMQTRTDSIDGFRERWKRMSLVEGCGHVSAGTDAIGRKMLEGTPWSLVPTHSYSY